MTAPDEPAVPGGRPPWRTDRGFERVVFFSDAVVAIAMTLLILPMVDTVTTDKAVGVGDLFRDHWGEMFAFALSFVVIAFYWTRHHRLFETIDRYTGTIVWLNMGWLASIVFLPLPTEVLAQASTDDSAAHTFYIGTLVVSERVVERPRVHDLEHAGDPQRSAARPRRGDGHGAPRGRASSSPWWCRPWACGR